MESPPLSLLEKKQSEKQEELRPDLVLMDITLGKGIDGIEAATG